MTETSKVIDDVALYALILDIIKVQKNYAHLQIGSNSARVTEIESLINKAAQKLEKEKKQ